MSTNAVDRRNIFQRFNLVYFILCYLAVLLVISATILEFVFSCMACLDSFVVLKIMLVPKIILFTSIKTINRRMVFLFFAVNSENQVDKTSYFTPLFPTSYDNLCCIEMICVCKLSIEIYFRLLFHIGYRTRCYICNTRLFI